MERRKMTEDDTTQSSVSRKPRWRTNDTINWRVHGNYVKGRRAPVSQH